MLVDANLLLYARDESSPFHERARTWLTVQLNGPVRVGLSWHSLVAFVRTDFARCGELRWVDPVTS